MGKLYNRYQLDMVGSEVPLLEMQDVICLLKDKKVLYIQKDHLSARLDICRLVQCVCVMERVPIIHSSYDVYMRNIVNDMSACMITEVIQVSLIQPI